MFTRFLVCGWISEQATEDGLFPCSTKHSDFIMSEIQPSHMSSEGSLFLHSRNEDTIANITYQLLFQIAKIIRISHMQYHLHQFSAKSN